MELSAHFNRLLRMTLWGYCATAAAQRDHSAKTSDSVPDASPCESAVRQASFQSKFQKLRTAFASLPSASGVSVKHLNASIEALSFSLPEQATILLARGGDLTKQACEQTMATLQSNKNRFAQALLDDFAFDRVADAIESRNFDSQIHLFGGSKYKTIATYSEPTGQTSSTVSYQIPEVKLSPGECAYFRVPSSLQNRPITFAIIAHRQDPEENTGTTEDSKWDNVPGLSSVQILGSESQDDWNYWKGDSSGAFGAKFAEVSHSPEIENLYEWQKIGHAKINGGIASSSLSPKMSRVCATGKDPVRLSEFTLKVAPPVPTLTNIGIYSPGTKFADPKSGLGGTFGGGQSHKGKFPDAVILDYDSGKKKLANGVVKKDNELSIPLETGKFLSGVEVACGDSHPDEIRNEDGGWGTKGWAKLSIGVRRKDGSEEIFMENENVPPEGFLIGTPEILNKTIAAGDRLFIRGDSDTVYLMGFRVGYIDKALP